MKLISFSNLLALCLLAVQVQGIPLITEKARLISSTNLTLKNFITDRYKSTSTEAVHFCNLRQWGHIKTSAAWDGINYLRDLRGEWELPGGHGICFRASCSYHTAIWICNDSPADNRSAWSIAGDMAERILVLCGIGGNGQIWNEYQYNVILREDGNNC